MPFKSIVPLLFLGLLACSKSQLDQPTLDAKTDSNLYSMIGKEYQVKFQALYRSSYRNLEDVEPDFIVSGIQKTTQFLFGPLTYRQLGGVQKGATIHPLLEKAYVENNRVVVPYQYEGTWMIESTASTLRLPIPYSIEGLRTPHWQSCTDPYDEDHRTWSFFWYFWDPSRSGCEHKVGEQYQEVQIQIGQETEQTKASFPEYKNLLRTENGVPTLSMTFAFGYVKDSPRPQPFTDSDPGAREFQKFYQRAKNQLATLGLKETSIHQSDITEGNLVIGSQFEGLKNGVRLRVSIVSAAGVDQMDLFAHSYAQKHESFFGWFGHSRVGSGFDADLLKQKLDLWPDQFSITPDYQVVYWGGCNSYSYYTQPFFELKSLLDPQNDPFGTRKLDLISNALPSLFAFNAANAQVMLNALLNWERPTSYQQIINEIESYARSRGTEVIVNVLGDEDNT